VNNRKEEPALPVVAVVGRPNVGKSTLVNRVIGRREAIVEERPGVTRDRKAVEAEWRGREFLLVDTGGWLGGEGGSLDAQVSRQAERAIREADVVVLVVDATVGITDADDRVAGLLRRSGRPALVAVNKVDNQAREADAWEFARLGLGQPLGVSALHGRQSGDFLDALVEILPTEEDRATKDRSDGESLDSIPGVAIVGRPNVGKSTLFNRLIGDERAIVHDQPGTTRDTIDTLVNSDAGPIRFIDTAGMRRRSRIDEATEYYSMVRALRAVDTADAALLVIDATEGVAHQDQRLAERVDVAGTAMVVVLNKWEAVPTEKREAVSADVADRLQFVGYAPVLRVSALTGKGVHRVMPALAETIEAYHRRVPTRELNEVVQSAQSAHAGTGARVLYCTQGAIDPPTFTLFANRPLAPTYLRYLERKIREHFGFGPTPLKLRVRQRAG